MQKLTQKQETFCLKYFELGNATEAAIIAGYSPKYAATHTTRWLNMANIKQRLEELRQIAQDETVGTVIERKQRLTAIMRGTIPDFVDESGDIKVEKDTPNKGAVSEVVTKEHLMRKMPVSITTLKLHNPIPAIAELNKMEGEYPPSKMELTGKGGGPMEVKELGAKDLTDEELLDIINRGRSRRKTKKKQGA